MQQIKLKKVLDDLKSDVGAPVPKIIADEYRGVFLFFYLRDNHSDWDGSSVHIRKEDDEDIACVHFKLCEQFKFGSPNDEAIEGHPYYKYGLKAYSIFEVENSDWIDSLEKMNAVHPYHKKENFENYKHYIFFFHDSCFEIVCKDFEIKRFPESTLKDEMIKTIKTLD